MSVNSKELISQRLPALTIKLKNNNKIKLCFFLNAYDEKLSEKEKHQAIFLKYDWTTMKTQPVKFVRQFQSYSEKKCMFSMHSFFRSLSKAEMSKCFTDSHPNRMLKVPGEKLTKSINISLVACWILCPQESWEISTILTVNRNLKERTMSGPPLFTAAQQAYPHYQPKNTLCQEKNNMDPAWNLWKIQTLLDLMRSLIKLDIKIPEHLLRTGHGWFHTHFLWHQERTLPPLGE